MGFFVGSKNSSFVKKIRFVHGAGRKGENRTDKAAHAHALDSFSGRSLRVFISYRISFSVEQEEMTAGEMILNDLQKLFFFALMGIGFLIDLVRMREDKNKAFVFLLLTLLLGGFSGGVGAMQAQFIFHMMGEG